MNPIWLTFVNGRCQRVDVFFEFSYDDFKRCAALFELGYRLKEIEPDL
jgi:hypothetical protein